MSVNHSARSGDKIGIVFSISVNMKVYCVFSLESLERKKKKNKEMTLNCPKSAAMGFFSKGLKNDFEKAVVNEPSVFETLKH